MRRSLLLTLAALVLASLACSTLFGGSEGEAPASDGDDGSSAATPTPEDSGDLELDDLEGMILEGLDEGLGTGAFPAEFPLPESMTISSDYELDNTVNAILEYQGTWEEAVAAFEESLPAGGWTIDSQDNLTTPVGEQVTLNISSADSSGYVTILASEVGIGIQITLEQ